MRLMTSLASFILLAATPRAQALTIGVRPPLTIGVGVPAVIPISASGGSGSYTFSIAQNTPLPYALALDPEGPAITGTPAQTGSYPILLSVTDALAVTATVSFVITVSPPLAVPAVSLPTAPPNQSYAQQLTATGGSPPYTFSVASGSLPPGFRLDARGIVGGVTPGPAAVYAFTVRVTDAQGTQATQSVSLTVADALRLDPTPPQPANVASAYSFAIRASGGAPPYTFAIATGTLPQGLALSASGVIGGTPLAIGSSSVVVRVTDSAQQSVTTTLAFQVLPPIPLFKADSVGNGASFQPGLAPGAYASITGANLAASTLAANTNPLPDNLGGVIVTLNGNRVAMLAVSPTQINFQVPFATPIGNVTLVVTSQGVSSPGVLIGIFPTAPGIFQASPNRALAIHEDGTLVDAAHPARTGEVIVIYATGGGKFQTDAPEAGLSLVIANPLQAPAVVTIGTQPAEVLYAGAAPGQGSGLVQVNVRIPDLAPGDYAVNLSIGGKFGNAPLLPVAAP